MRNILNLLWKNKINDCFVIFSAPRTGSNLLCGCLNSHPEIICHHEIFNPENIYYSLDHRNNDFEFSIKNRDKDPFRFISYIAGKKFGKKIFGFKMMPGHNRAAEDFILNNKNIKKIVLNRENKIKAFVSLQIAMKTNCYSLLEESNESTNTIHREKIFIDLKELKKYIKSYEDYYNKIIKCLSETEQNYFLLTYEDLTSKETDLLKEKLLVFLDVEPDPCFIKPRHVKQNPDNLNELIENYDEIKALLQGTSLEGYLL